MKIYKLDECFHDIFYSNFLQMKTCVVYVKFLSFSVSRQSSFCFQKIHFIIASFSLIALQNETILYGLSISLFQRNILLNILLPFELQEEFYNEFTLNCTFKYLKKKIIAWWFHLPCANRPIWCAFWTTIFHAIGNYDWIKFEYSVYFFSFSISILTL